FDGKYMRKTKTAGEVALMEVAQSSLGVRTRAKTLALQRLQNSAATAASSSGGSYLQLRSRRLEKPPIVVPSDSKRPKQPPKESSMRNPKPNPNSRTSSRLRVGLRILGLLGPSRSIVWKKRGFIWRRKKLGAERMRNRRRTTSLKLLLEKMCWNLKVERVRLKIWVPNAVCCSFVLMFGGSIIHKANDWKLVLMLQNRDTRESTPCSLIRDPENVRTPGSTTRPTTSSEVNRRMQNSSQRQIPSTNEMDEFFGGAEEQQRSEFIEKYNFDPVNDKPLPGRYEWVKVDP
ncbi:unnamed protein product, partial [Thlaspi arvense]